ncbi:uncharacterized mitochondrial protein-like protein, partial [Tanacetum coccineum]
MKKMYCLVVTDDFTRFSWVFFLATKDETSEILKIFITGIENLIDLRVKVIRCDNGTEFKNRVMNQLCEIKGRKPALSFMRPFGCPVTILNTIDHLGKFDGKADEGFFVGYSTNSKAFRVFNSRTRIVEENLHVQFSENTSNIAGSGPNWLFDIDALTNSMNYKPVVAGNQSNGNAGTKACDNAGKARVETVPGKDYILLPLWTQDPPFSSSSKDSPDAGFKPSGEEEKKDAKDPGNESGNPTEGKDSEVPSTEEPRINQEKDDYINSTNNINTASDGNNTNNVNAVSSTVNAAGTEVNAVDPKTSIELPNDPNMPELEDIVYSDDDEDVGAEADMNNLDAFMPVSPIPTTRIHKDHPVDQIIRDLNSTPQTRRMTKNMTEHAMFSSVQQRTNYKDFQNCLFACFLSQEDPKKVIQALKDPSWIKAMQDELLQFKLQMVWTLVDLPNDKRAIGTKWVYKNKKDERELKKSDEMKSMLSPPGFEDLTSLTKYIKVKKDLWIASSAGAYDIIFGSTKKKLCTEFEKMMHKKCQMSSMGELTFFLGLQVKQKNDGIFISQDKYVTKILKRFGFSDVKAASTPMETHKPLLKYADVNPKVSHLHAVKRIFRYLKSQPKLGLWYPKDSPFNLVAYTDSDYTGASLDRKSTIGGCQFLGSRLISWPCKKQTVVANSITEAEYVAASSCCGQVLWIQNQLLDYGDSNEKKLIKMIKIHTDKNVADLLTKAFDKGIRVNADNSKLMLLGINLLLLEKVNAARHNLLLLV